MDLHFLNASGFLCPCSDATPKNLKKFRLSAAPRSPGQRAKNARPSGADRTPRDHRASPVQGVPGSQRGESGRREQGWPRPRKSAHKASRSARLDRSPPRSARSSDNPSLRGCRDWVWGGGLRGRKVGEGGEGNQALRRPARAGLRVARERRSRTESRFAERRRCGSISARIFEASAHRIQALGGSPLQVKERIGAPYFKAPKRESDATVALGVVFARLTTRKAIKEPRRIKVRLTPAFS